MPAFKRFGPYDLLDNVLVLEPRYELASGTGGWRGSPDGSASLALYGGARRSGIVRKTSYPPIHPALAQFGPQIRSAPQTSSIHLAWMTKEDLDADTISPERWGNEHWSTIEGLYRYYAFQDPDFVTSSYDYYCLFFQPDSANCLSYQALISQGIWLTSSFAVESWIKPLSTTGQNRTIASMNGLFWFGITGSNGTLAVSSSFGTHTSSIAPDVRRWSHVAFSYDAATKTGSFVVNLKDAGTFEQDTFSGSIGPNVYDPIFSIGNQLYQPAIDAGNIEDISSLGGSNAFHGFIGETRLWSIPRSISIISGSFDGPIAFSTGNVGSIIRTLLNDGPLATFPNDLPNVVSMGSGSIDVAAVESIASSTTSKRWPWGLLVGFGDRSGPTWHPNDNVGYYPQKRLAGPPLTHPNMVQACALTDLTGSGIDLVKRMLVIDIPSAFYGREISPGSVRIVDSSFSGASYGLMRTIVDDGRGGLYISGSACSSSLSDREEYAGVGWNKVGNVFYGEGLIVIKDPSLLDMFRSDGSTVQPSDLLQLSFRGLTRLPVKTIMCRLEPGEFNASLNQTFWEEDEVGNRIIRHQSGSIRISTIGIYNEDRELVGIARMAEPIRKRPQDRQNFKLRMDF